MRRTECQDQGKIKILTLRAPQQEKHEDRDRGKGLKQREDNGVGITEELLTLSRVIQGLNHR